MICFCTYFFVSHFWKLNKLFSKKYLWIIGGRHSSVDPSMPSILRLWVLIPSTPLMLLSIYIWIVWRENDKINKKRAGLAQIKKRLQFVKIMDYSNNILTIL